MDGFGNNISENTHVTECIHQDLYIDRVFRKDESELQERGEKF